MDVNKNSKKQSNSNKKKVNNRGETPSRAFRLSSTTYFLTYGGVSPSGGRLTRQTLAKFLLQGNTKDFKLYPTKYIVCEQTYETGEPHLHAILVYPRRKEVISQDHYDYLGVHPNIQTMRNMKAALEYISKEDQSPVTNMDITHQRLAARAKDSSSLYTLLEEAMFKDPTGFSFTKYCLANDITREVYKANYTKALNLLRLVQPEVCNQLLRSKPGFKPIDRPLIQSRLTPEELKIYDSWDGYQKIVDHLNIMNVERGGRQEKSMNLLITGAPSSGKSALVWQRNPSKGRTSLLQHCSIYPMGMRDWFPRYMSDVYHCIYWNQAKLSSYSYDIILQLLDGSPVMLPDKGGGHKKVDNPLVLMTSNMTLDQLIRAKFSYNRRYTEMARVNLGVRVQNVVIPEGHNLFILQKLLVSAV